MLLRNYSLYLGSWNIFVGIFRSHAKQEGSGAQLSVCPNISGESFHRVKRPVREFDHLHLPGDEVRKEWS